MSTTLSDKGLCTKKHMLERAEKIILEEGIEALSMDYIRTARAKGLREKVVVYSHAWRNALLPVITVLIGWFISIFSGSLIIEQMFALNGMGQLYYQGLMNNDFELALAIQMFYVLIALVGQLITDLSYGIVDPRVRVNK